MKKAGTLGFVLMVCLAGVATMLAAEIPTDRQSQALSQSESSIENSDDFWKAIGWGPTVGSKVLALAKVAVPVVILLGGVAAVAFSVFSDKESSRSFKEMCRSFFDEEHEHCPYCHRSLDLE